MVDNSFSESYKSAGVDITAGYEGVKRIKPLVESTFTKGVIGSIGGFGGMFEPDTAGMKRPVIVSGTDGVGTKLKIAFAMNKHDTIGIDCVAMCVNDIVCGGAAPMFFLDYIALGKNRPEVVEQIVSGIAEGCRQAGCALVGGETAEMPGFYPEDEYDVAGFSAGIVDYEKIIDGSRIKPGDKLIGLPSSGVHSNGFSLVRKILGDTPEALSEYVPSLGHTLGEELLIPTRIYVPVVLHLVRTLGFDIKGISHITGGGFYENLPRMLPDGVRMRVDAHSYPVPEIFNIISERGNISTRDMYNTFNMGIGLVMAVDSGDAGKVVEALIQAGERPYVIGCCVADDKNEGKGVDLKW